MLTKCLWWQSFNFIAPFHMKPNWNMKVNHLLRHNCLIEFIIIPFHIKYINDGKWSDNWIYGRDRITLVIHLNSCQNGLKMIESKLYRTNRPSCICYLCICIEGKKTCVATLLYVYIKLDKISNWILFIINIPKCFFLIYCKYLCY